MNYEKKYKDLIKAVKELQEANPSDERVQNWVNENVPELKESEDERIRKNIKIALMSMEDNLADFYSTHRTSQKELLNWLEKQGENNMGISESTKQKLEDNLNKALEKETPESWNEFLEGQGEQKPTDKTEPKFKVGDWVVNTITHYVEQIIGITNNVYICSECPIVSFENQHLLKKWTIKDAKGGDVLSFNDGHGNDCIELIKSITDKKIEFWFCLTNSNRYEVFDGNLPYTNLASRKDAHPASKEQRDLLFAKMKEAGYEWNADKKELKKIEQNPAWSEEDEKMVECCEIALEAFENLGKYSQGFPHENYFELNERIYPSEVNRWLKSIKERVQSKQYWSDEDYNEIETIACHLDNTDNEGMADVLRNIRDKYYHIIPQNTWKPSDEQMGTFWDAICNLNQDGYKWINDMKSLYQDLKKLKG